MTERAFERALQRFAAVVGSDWVFSSDADVALYRDAYSPMWGQPDERLASAAVAPASVEEVQAVMRVANELRVPVYPISTGKNLGYGGSAPNYSGSVVLDLKRMNRILDVDEVNHSVLVEPGVSYFDLYEHFKANDVRMIMDCPDPGWGSLIGNALDRGGGYTMAHLRNHFDAHCGMEVVLADGTLVRTGMGALPNAKTWQQYKTGCGPWIDGIFSQSSFGVVTKMGFWLMPEPEAYRRCKVFVPRYDDLHRFVEILNYCENAKLFTGMPAFSSPLLGSGSVADLAGIIETGGSRLPEEQAALIARAELGYSAELEAYGLREGVPYWGLDVPFYGPPEMIEGAWQGVRRHFSAIEGATFEEGELFTLPLSREQQERIHHPELGIPTLRMFSIGARTPFNPTPSSGHMWFSPIIPRTGAAIIEANRVFQEAARSLDLPILGGFSLPSLYWERAFIYIFGVPVTRNAEADAKAVAGLKELIRIAGERGWGEYRTPPVFQDDVMAQYSFNDNALAGVHERLKAALDPNGIISIGRYGIWPGRTRDQGA